MRNNLACRKLVTGNQMHRIPPLLLVVLLVGSSNDSFSLGQRQDMSNQLTIRQEVREVAALEKVDKEGGDVL